LRVGQSIKLPAAAAPQPTQASTQAPAATSTPPPSTAEPSATEPPASPTEAAPTDTPAPEATATPSSLGQSYTVQEGDFPAKIAEKFGISVEELLAANPSINPTDMHIGDVIVIPPKRTSP
jgi:LysM repeat protein